MNNLGDLVARVSNLRVLCVVGFICFAGPSLFAGSEYPMTMPQYKSLTKKTNPDLFDKLDVNFVILQEATSSSPSIDGKMFNRNHRGCLDKQITIYQGALEKIRKVVSPADLNKLKNIKMNVWIFDVSKDPGASANLNETDKGLNRISGYMQNGRCNNLTDENAITDFIYSSYLHKHRPKSIESKSSPAGGSY